MVVVEKASETSSEILWTYRIVQLFKFFFAEVLTYDCIFLASMSATSFIIKPHLRKLGVWKIDYSNTCRFSWSRLRQEHMSQGIQERTK